MVHQLPAIAEHDNSWDFSEVEALVRVLVDLAEETPLVAGQGMRWASPAILDLEVDGVRCRLIRLAQAPTVLSPREQEIACMVAKGCPNKMIASALDISSWTVASHLRRVFSKLGVSSRAAMVARLFEDGATANPDVGARM
jgi:two-component system nitrate/nitrite response regulator NarL